MHILMVVSDSPSLEPTLSTFHKFYIFPVTISCHPLLSTSTTQRTSTALHSALPRHYTVHFHGTTQCTSTALHSALPWHYIAHFHGTTQCTSMALHSALPRHYTVHFHGTTQRTSTALHSALPRHENTTLVE